METTKLYVEYIVVGMETLAIIFLVIFIIIGDAFLPIIKYCIKNIVPSIIMLGWCYILGLIVDRIADIIYDKRKMHIKEKYPIEAETSIIVWEHFKQDQEHFTTKEKKSNLVHNGIVFFAHLNNYAKFFCTYRLFIPQMQVSKFTTNAYILWEVGQHRHSRHLF